MGITFHDVVAGMTARGVEWHRDTILANTLANAPCVVNSIRAIKEDRRPCLIVSGGPSLMRERILERIHGKFQGTLICTDSALVHCLRAGIIPDYAITLDPHPTRMVRWFGDPELEKNLNGDDYFARTDPEFNGDAVKANEINIGIVNRYLVPLVIASTSPANVVARTAIHERYWFVPLVDDPEAEDSLTAQMVEATGVPAMNTGGTVGTAAWVLAHTVIKSPNIAVVGMDLGYYADTPHEKTQCWGMEDSPGYLWEDGLWGTAYTDATYFWYRENFRALLEAADARVVNCSGAGLFSGKRVDCMDLETWLVSC